MLSNIFYTVEISARLDTSLDLEYKFQFCNAFGPHYHREGRKYIYLSRKYKTGWNSQAGAQEKYRRFVLEWIPTRLIFGYNSTPIPVWNKVLLYVTIWIVKFGTPSLAPSWLWKSWSESFDTSFMFYWLSKYKILANEAQHYLIRLNQVISPLFINIFQSFSQRFSGI